MLGRYLAGESSETEVAAIRRFLMSRPEAAHALDTYIAQLDGAQSRPVMPDHGESWASLAARLRADESSTRPAAPPAAPARESAGRHQHFVLLPTSTRRSWWRSSYAIAAAVALALVALRATRSGPAASAPVSHTYATARAQRAEMRLTDGTRVVLAPGSKLRVATDFGTERRDIYLDGEAFFEVVHDELRPFTVYAGNASAHDIGTAFSVRSYAEDRSVQIVVREGVVAMSGVGPLAAGDVGLLSSDGKTSVRHGVDVDPMLGWLEGKLAFEDAPLARVVDDLRRWQGIEVEIRDSTLATLPFTGAINDLPPSSAIDLVAATLGLRVRRDGERYVLLATPGRTPRATGKVHRSSRHTSASTP